MDTDEIARLEELFHGAVACTRGPERDRFVEQACGGSEKLRARLQQLLAADEQQGMETGAHGPEELPRFGVFQAEALIGRGGMGAVYRAIRSDGQFQQRAAVKVIRFELADDRVMEAFRNERQLLADLSHPGIAAVFDGGVLPSGLPYLVMEYVEGERIDDYCRKRQIVLHERVQLLRQVCDAVAYAHRQLVVHHDLKPSNIFVSESGHIKVLDFGTAKALPGPQSAVTQELATPRYASPEQLRGDRTGIASDVFSLGVIAAELFSGVWPFGDPGSRLQSMRRAVEHTEASSLSDGATEQHAGECGTTLQNLRSALKGDLDAIVRKALASDPEARYRTVDAFSDDLAAYLNNEPVAARQGRRFYIAQKFFARHRVAILASVAALLTLAATTAIAIRQRQMADQNYAAMRDTTTAMLFDFKDAIKELPGATEAQRILVSRVLHNLDRMRSVSNDNTVRFDLAESYRQLGELQGDPYVENLGDTTSALASLAKAEALASEGIAGHGDDPAWLWVGGYVQQNIGEVLFSLNRTKEAADRLRKATWLFDRMAQHTKDESRLLDAAGAHGVLGDVLGSTGLASLSDAKGADAEYSKAIAVDMRVLEANRNATRARRGIAIGLMKRSDVSREANTQFALQLIDEAIGRLNELEEAELKKPATLRIRYHLLAKRADILAQLGRWAEARDALRDPLRAARERVASDPKDERAAVDLATAEGKLLDVAYHEGARDALTISEEAIATWKRVSAHEAGVLIYRTELAVAEGYRAVLLMRAGRFVEARGQAANARLELKQVEADPEAGPYQKKRCEEAKAELEAVRL